MQCFHEAIDNGVLIMAITENILPAQQHLEAGVRQQFTKRAQALPGVIACGGEGAAGARHRHPDHAHRREAGRCALQPRPGTRRTAGPFEDIAEGEAARGAGQRRQFPLGLGGQAPAGPAAPGLRLVAADMHGGLRRADALHLPLSLHQHALAHLFDVARRAARLGLHPGPALGRPPLRVVVAAVGGEFGITRPADGLGVDLELGDRHLVRPALVVGHETAGRRTDGGCLRRHPQGLARRSGRWRVPRWRRVGFDRQLRRRRDLCEVLADAVLVQQRGAEEVQRVVRRVAAGQQFERGVHGLGHEAAHPFGIGQDRKSVV